MCGMLPMADAIEDLLHERNHNIHGEHEETNPADPDDDVFEALKDESFFGWEENEPEADPLKQALRIIREEVGIPSHSSESVPPFQETPVFLGHGSKDDKVLLRHGQQACRVLRLMGCNVDLREYCKLDHWYSEDMLQHMLEFLGGERVILADIDEAEETGANHLS
ncbi:uncharacterized protein ColSpa_04356 [Colletotrichum spaethianum]|uniref:Phospholipase/carboxylesterase/thioesterase domain-containing protein n=1 Tax=Colletotrichum spaethianum TaxID=700344 RepID=A0AA37LCQ2_9PEZI|nr:uncharacterized protein ColSpa_04356 [Colletotrichum spaethianum]GKT44175.1 hypothetical protein ColSpa_04356 [Colletotrichum spaethianum]